MRRRLALSVYFALVAGLAAAEPESGARPFTRQELEPVLERLLAEGFPRARIEQIFLDPRLRKLDAVISFNAVNRDGETRYRQYLSPYAIFRAEQFKRRHLDELAAVEARYGVPKEIVVAVLLVETQFGSHPRKFRVLEVFTSLAVETDPSTIDRHHERLKTAYPEIEREYIATRLRKKAGWAYRELVALLNIAQADPDALFNLKGSYAGAFGLPQFLPSTYLQWAVDGDNDRRIDLDGRADALASVSNFLREHGWTAHASAEEKRQAVWRYNNSNRYVETIFGIHDLLTMTAISRPVGAASAAVAPAIEVAAHPEPAEPDAGKEGSHPE
ncbi:MAG: lytic murein transglycosylase [Candidatus Lambdaproteobacteria bacterium]|nr:lytic murein transglycosylase [Candidatus Lambdaproteobacteria bacterium]